MWRVTSLRHMEPELESGGNTFSVTIKFLPICNHCCCYCNPIFIYIHKIIYIYISAMYIYMLYIILYCIISYHIISYHIILYYIILYAIVYFAMHHIVPAAPSLPHLAGLPARPQALRTCSFGRRCLTVFPLFSWQKQENSTSTPTAKTKTTKT